MSLYLFISVFALPCLPSFPLPLPVIITSFPYSFSPSLFRLANFCSVSFFVFFPYLLALSFLLLMHLSLFLSLPYLCFFIYHTPSFPFPPSVLPLTSLLCLSSSLTLLSFSLHYLSCTLVVYLRISLYFTLYLHLPIASFFLVSLFPYPCCLYLLHSLIFSSSVHFIFPHSCSFAPYFYAASFSPPSLPFVLGALDFPMLLSPLFSLYSSCLPFLFPSLRSSSLAKLAESPLPTNNLLLLRFVFLSDSLFPLPLSSRLVSVNPTFNFLRISSLSSVFSH